MENGDESVWSMECIDRKWQGLSVNRRSIQGPGALNVHMCNETKPNHTKPRYENEYDNLRTLLHSKHSPFLSLTLLRFYLR